MARRPTLPPPFPEAPAPGAGNGDEPTGGSGFGQDEPSRAAPPARAWPEPGFEMERIPRHKLNRIKNRGRLGWLLFLGVTIASAAAGALGYARMATLSTDLTAARKEAAQALSVRDEAVARTDTQKAEIAALEQKASSFADKARTVDQQVAAQAAAVEANANTIEELKAAVEGSETPVLAEGDRILILIDEDELFSRDATDLESDGIRVLARLGKPLKAAKDRHFVVTAHGPAKGARRSKTALGGWELSGARAARVARYLVEDTRLEGARVSALARTRSGKRGKIEISVQRAPAKPTSQR